MDSGSHLELLEVDRLVEEVIGAQFEAADDQLLVVDPGQHDDGGVDAGLSPQLENLGPEHGRQELIQEDEVEVVLHSAVERIEAVLNRGRLPAESLEVAFDQAGDDL